MTKIKLTPAEKNAIITLLRSKKRITHPNYYSGTGRFSKRSADHAGKLEKSLQKIGLVKGRHYIAGNDAPRGGWTGEFVKILPAALRLKNVRQLIQNAEITV